MSFFSLNPYTLLIALLGGIIPAFVWLWFWLKEDALHPEPRRFLAMAFLAGMLAVPFAFFAEKTAFSYLGSGIAVIVAWSAIEELLKLLGAYIAVFKNKPTRGIGVVDEPIDPLIYLITVALGFAALENALFLMNPLLAGDTVSGILTGNLRFIGAMLLHVVASGTIGLGMALSFYKSPPVKIAYIGVGIIVSIALHALFNLSIIIFKGESIFLIFGVLWLFVGALLLAFERVKKIKKREGDQP